MAAVAQPEADEIPEMRIQVLIQVRNPLQALVVPGVHIRSRVGDILTAQISPESVNALEADPNVVYVERAATVTMEETPEPSAAAKIEIPDGPLDETGKDVIVGIIDWGCDFTHGDFRNESGSRILYFWDHFATPGSGHRPPYGYSGGVEFDKAALNRALEERDPFAALGIKPPPLTSHGTHVMGIAAGNGREVPSAGVRGLAPEADIIFVQPNIGDVDITGGFGDPFAALGDSVNLAEAVKYVFEKADTLNRPAVVNLSFATNSGPHDGTTLVEQWIDRVLGAPGRAMVLALGNEHPEPMATAFAPFRWNRTHAEGRLSTGETTTLYWRALFGDFTPNEVEIWYSGRDIFVLEVVLPDGETVPIVEPGQAARFDVGHAGTQVYVSNQLHSPLNGDNSINVIVFSRDQMPAGVWQLRLTSRLSREGAFDAWIERDASRPPLQSSFIGGSYVRRKTLGSIQSARHAITVSNYDAYTITLADSTSVGPTRDGRRAPLVAAPGVEIFAANSRYRAAEHPRNRNPYTSMTGTSMSSSYVAGIVACMLEKNRRLTAAQIKGLLAAQAKPAPGIGSEYRPDWGHGRVDPVDTLSATPAPQKEPEPEPEPAPCPVTEVHSEGPFYREGAPFTNDLYPGDSTGPVLYFRGTVSDTDCNRLSGVTVHVWHADEYGGGYDNQDPTNPPPPDFFRCRARMTSDEEGVFEFRTVLPANYRSDPVRMPQWWRVRHLHFKLFLEGFEPYTTELCFEPDDYLATDFWVKPELVIRLEEVRDGDGSAPYFRAGFDFVLKPISMRNYLDEAMRLGILPGS